MPSSFRVSSDGWTSTRITTGKGVPRQGRAAAVLPALMDDDVVLSGGNMTPIVRVGDTVRRAAGPWTSAIHALLRHVRAAGFDRVPEPLGIDGRGREILSFVPGRVATYPLEDFVWSDRMLARVAQMLRAYDDATAGLRSAGWPPEACSLMHADERVGAVQSNPALSYASALMALGVSP